MPYRAIGQAFPPDLHAAFAFVLGNAAAVGLTVQIPFNQRVYRRNHFGVRRHVVALLQHVFQPVGLFHHVAAGIGREQPTHIVLEILEPPLHQLGACVAHNGVGHLDAQPLKHARRGKRFAAIGQTLLGAVPTPADVVGQKFAAVVHIHVRGNSAGDNALAERIQRGLTAGIGGHIPAGKNTAAGIQPGAQI